MDKYIEFQHITKIFPGQKALDDVSFSVKQGEVHALLGENGAGKSTLLNILHGMFPATQGKVFIEGEEVKFRNALEAIHYGIAKVHQEINIIPELTVAQNMMLGGEPTKGPLLNRKKMEKETQELLDRLGCAFHADDRVGTLSTGKKQMIQIAKALYMNAKVISFDEPTSSLSNSEVKTLFKIIRDLKAQGITILYISHKMDEIFQICDRASILRDGKYVTTLDMKETTEEDLVQNMVGRDVSMFAQRLKPSCVDKNNTVLKVEHLSGPAGFDDISFELKKGEILGFFGLVGAMRTEVMRAIFGADKASGGTVIYNGKALPHNRTPNDVVKMGIGLVSENRKEEGFVKNFNNADNIALASLTKYVRGIFVKESLKQKNSIKVGETVGLTPNDPEFLTVSLSGGNAQKVILAKWLSTDVDVLIMDEPTKGIDIGAKAEIYKLMEEIVAAGKSIIMVSSEMTEVIGMSDRVLVMREGKLVGELDRSELEEERIITYAVGGSQG
ncbi:sugar ABC transporter ATP-binding protein [Diplocloster agilis]|uniref:Sugar ABC transporter ATP-binding protein n=1 Tax=Diplocloster agilis TaxID=2850323 RepID=A0A949NGK4_9FIRM|nr:MULTISPECIES: sugar ABC transporter ATP-binding protein [Lachnospiraceae]MBU9738994.1 sugar ABC transporter ATP-binding protein [Diplocloster agilis]MCU6735897.1 sugar ABC transporter ATP-binding protein [Suonthocola fibrivorans]SCJ83876.1 Arabinose import ATP-binding protein AraG [uncultured Clostridium sp.]